MRQLLWAIALVGSMAVPSLAAEKELDLVVTAYERWIDTVQGQIKNFSGKKAYETTVIIKFVNAKEKVMGWQAVTVGDLDSGEERSFSAPIPEKYRRDVRTFRFEPHALWQNRR